MNNEPRHTLNTFIYRDVAETINKTLFEVYVKESYMPVVHGVYLDNPSITPINAPDPFDMDNMCYSRLPLKNLIDMLATGQEFWWKYGDDVAKAEGILKTYVDQFDGINLDRDPDAKAFLEKVKLAYSNFHQKHKEQIRRTAPPKRLSIVDRIRAMGSMSF